MDEYYSKMPVVKAVIYNDETVVEIVTEFWRRGYFVRIEEENLDKMMVMEMYDTSATEIMPGQYVVFHTENQYGISFDVIGWDEFRQKYALHAHKAATTEDISKENTHG